MELFLFLDKNKIPQILINSRFFFNKNWKYYKKTDCNTIVNGQFI